MTQTSPVKVVVTDREDGPVLLVLGLTPEQRAVADEALGEVRDLIELTLREMLGRDEMNEPSFRSALPQLLALDLKRQLYLSQARACAESSLALVRGDILPSAFDLAEDS